MIDTSGAGVMRLIRVKFYRKGNKVQPAYTEWTWLPPRHSLHAFAVTRTVGLGFDRAEAEVEMELAIGDREVGQ